MNILEQAGSASRATLSSGTKAYDPGRKELGKNDFLRLLTTQMQAQDPLNPMDNTEFVAQLSQFTSLERLENMSTSMERVALSTAANTSAQMVSFIGKNVEVTSNKVHVDDAGHVQSANFDLAHDAVDVQVTIKNADGRVVRTVDLGGHERGEQTFVWDGLSDDGGPADAGAYTIEIAAKDTEGAPVSVRTTASRKVQGITFKGGVPTLQLEHDEEVGLADVRQVGE